MRNPLGASTGGFLLAIRSMALGTALAIIASCRPHPSAGNTSAERKLADSTPSVLDTVGCDMVATQANPQPFGLVREYLRRDEIGEFTSTSRWHEEAVTCPGHLPGWDAVTVVTASRIQSLTLGPDTARYAVTYDILGELDDDSTGPNGLRVARRAELDTFVVLRTPFGWRIDMPVINPHVSLDVAHRFPLKSHDRRVLDSLASLRKAGA